MAAFNERTPEVTLNRSKYALIKAKQKFDRDIKEAISSIDEIDSLIKSIDGDNVASIGDNEASIGDNEAASVDSDGDTIMVDAAPFSSSLPLNTDVCDTPMITLGKTLDKIPVSMSFPPSFPLSSSSLPSFLNEAPETRLIFSNFGNLHDKVPVSALLPPTSTSVLFGNLPTLTDTLFAPPGKRLPKLPLSRMYPQNFSRPLPLTDTDSDTALSLNHAGKATIPPKPLSSECSSLNPVSMSFPEPTYPFNFISPPEPLSTSPSADITSLKKKLGTKTRPVGSFKGCVKHTIANTVRSIPDLEHITKTDEFEIANSVVNDVERLQTCIDIAVRNVYKIMNYVVRACAAEVDIRVGNIVRYQPRTTVEWFFRNLSNVELSQLSWIVGFYGHTANDVSNWIHKLVRIVIDRGGWRQTRAKNCPYENNDEVQFNEIIYEPMTIDDFIGASGDDAEEQEEEEDFREEDEEEDEDEDDDEDDDEETEENNNSPGKKVDAFTELYRTKFKSDSAQRLGDELLDAIAKDAIWESHALHEIVDIPTHATYIAREAMTSVVTSHKTLGPRHWKRVLKDVTEKPTDGFLQRLLKLEVVIDRRTLYMAPGIALILSNTIRYKVAPLKSNKHHHIRLTETYIYNSIFSATNIRTKEAHVKVFYEWIKANCDPQQHYPGELIKRVFIDFKGPKYESLRRQLDGVGKNHRYDNGSPLSVMKCPHALLESLKHDENGIARDAAGRVIFELPDDSHGRIRIPKLLLSGALITDCEDLKINVIPIFQSFGNISPKSKSFLPNIGHLLPELSRPLHQCEEYNETQQMTPVGELVDKDLDIASSRKGLAPKVDFSKMTRDALIRIIYRDGSTCKCTDHKHHNCVLDPNIVGLDLGELFLIAAVALRATGELANFKASTNSFYEQTAYHLRRLVELIKASDAAKSNENLIDDLESLERSLVGKNALSVNGFLSYLVRLHTIEDRLATFSNKAELKRARRQVKSTKRKIFDIFVDGLLKLGGANSFMKADAYRRKNEGRDLIFSIGLSKNFKTRGRMPSMELGFRNHFVSKCRSLGYLVVGVVELWTSQCCPRCQRVGETVRDTKDRVKMCRRCDIVWNRDIFAAQAHAVILKTILHRGYIPPVYSAPGDDELNDEHKRELDKYKKKKLEELREKLSAENVGGVDSSQLSVTTRIRGGYTGYHYDNIAAEGSTSF